MSHEVRQLAGADQRAILEQFAAAADTGRPVAVLGFRWPATAQAAADAALGRAKAAGRIGDGDLVVFSTGSTGIPRGIVRTADSWRASADPLTGLLELAHGDVVGIPGTLDSSLSLYGAWHAHQAGLELILADEWRTRAGEITVVHTVPARLETLLAGPSLPKLRLAVVAGDRLPPGVAQACQARGIQLVEYYGAAETSFVLVSSVRNPTGIERDPERVTSFRPFPGVEIRRDRLGRLWSRSGYAFRDYLDPANPGLALRDGDWITVGDLVRPGPDGGVSFLGRPGTITTGGHTVVVAEVEDHLARTPGVRAAVVAGIAHPRLGQIVGAVVESELTLGELTRAVAHWPAPSRPRRWVVLDRLPRLESGKPDRRACADTLALP